jgi:hypothetical protein
MSTSVEKSFIRVKWKLHWKAKVDEIGLTEMLHTLEFVEASLVDHEWKEWSSISTFEDLG